MPISNYMELIQTLNWDDEKRTQERWYVFIVMNPMNQTNAGIDIIKNFSYLDVRTGNVTFFLPGFSNVDNGVVPYSSKDGEEVVYEDESFGKIYFDKQGFLNTISWLERNCPTYHYSDDLDLLILKYRPISESNNISIKIFEECLDFSNMIIYNLDTLKKAGTNIVKTIMECKKVIELNAQSEGEIKKHLDNLIYD